MESYSRTAHRVVLTLGLLACSAWPVLAQTVSDLGAAQNFTVLGGSAVTSTGLTIVNGNLGVSPGTSITGFPPGLVINGSIFNNVPPATTAHTDTITAYNLLAGAPMTANLTSLDLGGMTLAPGVYKFDTSAGLTGILTLDNTSNPTGAYVFQIGTTLTTATNSAVVQLGGTNPNIFWQVGSSATLGTGTDFVGNILALTSITMDPGASISIGRALSINGAVTMSGGNSMNLNAPGGFPLPAVGAFWNGSASNLWSDMNWSPDTTGAVTGSLAPAADVIFSVTGVAPQNQNTDLDVNALISSLTVNDPAAVSISGPNTLTILGASGATSTLTVNSGAGLTTINSDVVLGGLSQGITVDNTAGLVINGVVGGNLGLTKEGVGTVTLTGSNTYTGGTLINTGTVAVGDISGLQSSTALGIGSVINHAVLETTATTVPFSPAVKINVAGDYTQNGPGATLQLQVVTNQGPVTTQAAAGLNYDTLAATGDVSVDGSLRLNFETGSSAGQRFQLISTSGPNAVTNPGAFVAATVTGTPFIPITTYNNSFGGTYADNNVVVTLFQPFATYDGLTPNQTAVARNVDQFVTGAFANNTGNTQNSAETRDFFNNIVTGLMEAGNSPDSLGRALNELSPQRFEILRNVAFDNYAFDVQSLDDYLARVRNGRDGFDTSGMVFYDSALGSQLSMVKSRLLAWSPSFDRNLMADSTQPVLGGVLMPAPTDPKDVRYQEPVNRWNGFIDGGVELGDLDDNKDLERASYTTGRVRGGIDYRVTTQFRVGALMGYSHTDVDLDNEGSKAKVESYTPGIYLAYADKEGFYANGLFTYTRNEYKTERKIVIPGVDRTANGSPGGNQFGINADGGYEFHRGDWTFGPNVGLSYVNLGIDSFSESGADSANLNVDSQSLHSLRSRVGGTVRYKAKAGSVALIPHMSVFWQHEFLNETTAITSAFKGIPAGSFSVRTTEGDRDSALLGLGLDAEINETITLFLSYNAEAGGESYFGQSATGGVKIAF